MANFSKKTNRQEIIVVTLIYLIFFIIGILSYQDFGISVDEWDLRVLGFVNLKYITEIFFQNISIIYFRFANPNSLNSHSSTDMPKSS